MPLQDGSDIQAAVNGCHVFLVGKKLNTAGLKERHFERQLALTLVFGGELARFHLAGFDVRLIERVDSDDGAGDGRGDLPAEKFLREAVDLFDADAHEDRKSTRLNSSHGYISYAVFC